MSFNPLFVSTRDNQKEYKLSDIILKGTCEKGGLFIPKIFPKFTKDEIDSFATKNYKDICFDVLSPFTNTEISDDNLRSIIHRAYSTFSHEAVLPTKQISHNHYMAEMFYGETFAFKDFALSLLGGLIEYFLKIKSQEAIIIGATSGDTGSAAIYACKNLENVKVFILFPKGMVSPFQKNQMIQSGSKNVHPIEVDGTFDDCQTIVKQIFSDETFSRNLNKQIIAINSINFMRILIQSVYYFYIASRFNQNANIAFSIPSGNFGNIYSAIVAQEMGLKIDKLIVATNQNDILYRFFTNGDYSIAKVNPSLAPSMDISIASNFERFLYTRLNKDSQRVLELMNELKQNNKITPTKIELEILTNDVTSFRASNNDIITQIKDTYLTTGEIIEPHTASGIFAGNTFLKTNKNFSVITLATAHAIKFEDTLIKADITQRQINATSVVQNYLAKVKASNVKSTYVNLTANVTEIQKYILKH